MEKLSRLYEKSSITILQCDVLKEQVISKGYIYFKISRNSPELGKMESKRWKWKIVKEYNPIDNDIWLCSARNGNTEGF